jgi:hypothetical protein
LRRKSTIIERKKTEKYTDFEELKNYLELDGPIGLVEEQIAMIAGKLAGDLAEHSEARLAICSLE